MNKVPNFLIKPNIASVQVLLEIVAGKLGVRYGPGSGLCLETQVHPNAINIPHFPNTVLMPGETYRQKTIYKVASAVLK